MSSFKKLNKADVTVVPYNANKKWNINYPTPTLDSSQELLSVYTGKNVPFTSATLINNQYDSLVYTSTNHLFYQSYTASLDTGSLMFNVNTYESASQQRPTSSYFDYNINPLLIKQFPTGASDEIRVVVVDQGVYGNKILPNSIILSSSHYYIQDDGYGNLYDTAGILDDYIDLTYITTEYFVTGSVLGGVTFVGNVFYDHGTIVITNTTYSIDSYFPTKRCFDVTFTVFNNTVEYYDCSGNLQLIIGNPITPVISTVCVDLSKPITSGSGITIDSIGSACDGVFNLKFQNEHTIFENEVRCIVRESDYNLSYNPTLVNGSYASGSLRDFATGSSFQPYVTTIGLYNDTNDLLMVAKLAKPIVLSSDTDMTFIVRYDT